MFLLLAIQKQDSFLFIFHMFSITRTVGFFVHEDRELRIQNKAQKTNIPFNWILTIFIGLIVSIFGLNIFRFTEY
jgi:hypothetical protein